MRQPEKTMIRDAAKPADAPAGRAFAAATAPFDPLDPLPGEVARLLELFHEPSSDGHAAGRSVEPPLVLTQDSTLTQGE